MTEESENVAKGPTKNQEEADVGIFCYMSQLPGFRGILKQRFHLYKENKDTQEALRLIGKMLGVQVTIFKQRASRLASLNERLIGIKVGDFWTCTWEAPRKPIHNYIEVNYICRRPSNVVCRYKGQAICVYTKGVFSSPNFEAFGFAEANHLSSVTIFKQRASRLASLNERLIGIKVGDFCHVNEGLVLGQLRGNQFTITLRGVVADSDDTIKASADALGKHGFINYFGLQRFGCGTVPTHLVGAALLRGEWKAAIFNLQRDAIRKIQQYYKESNDIDGTLRQLPHNMVAERAILQLLKKCPGNYLQALKAVPRTLRMIGWALGSTILPQAVTWLKCMYTVTKATCGTMPQAYECRSMELKELF
ncbi:hypothetical protein Ancab_000906 [Ancistrocladus abbreviatus]